jgi:hypothetical protein
VVLIEQLTQDWLAVLYKDKTMTAMSVVAQIDAINHFVNILNVKLFTILMENAS